MTNVVDEFVISLGLDSSRWTNDQKAAVNALRSFEEQAHKSANAIEAESKKTANFMSDLKREAIGFAAVFLGGRGFKEFVGYVSNLDAATGRLSKTMGTNIEEVSAWQGAVKQAGGTVEGASTALAGLSGEMSTFQLTGQTSMLPVLSRLGISLYDANRNLKTSTQLWLELATAVEGMEPRQAQAFLAMIPGANQDMINFALLGRGAMESYIKSARDAGVTTKESAEAAAEYNRQLSLLDASATSLGRTLLVKLAPAATGLMNIWQKTISGSKDGQSMFNIAPNSGADAVRRWWNGDGSLVDNLKNSNMFGGTGTGNPVGEARARLAQGLRSQALPPAASGPMSPGYAHTQADVERMIRAAAVKRGIDPEIAMKVAQSEGFFNFKSTVPGEDSTGPFQLYHGSKGGGGLGTAFRKKTGLDAHDPSTVPQQIDFALDHASKAGWGSWYGWKGQPFAGIGQRPGAAGSASRGVGGAPAGGAGGNTTTVTIQNMPINAPNAKDADGIAREVQPALERAITAGAANYGPN